MNERGFTLIEIIMAILLTAIIVSAVFGVALSSRRGSGKAERRQLGAQASKALAAALRVYVAAETVSPSGAMTLHGPNLANAGAAMWSLHTAGVQTDSLGVGVYALYPWPSVGGATHRIDCVAGAGLDGPCFLPRVLRVAPYNGYINYTVTSSGSSTPPQVKIDVIWTEP